MACDGPCRIGIFLSTRNDPASPCLVVCQINETGRRFWPSCGPFLGGAAAEPVWPAQASSQGRLPVPEQAPPWLVSADTSNHPQTMQRRMPTIRVQVFSYYLLLLCVLKSTHSRHFPTIENGRVYDLPTEQTPAPLKVNCFLCLSLIHISEPTSTY